MISIETVVNVSSSQIEENIYLGDQKLDPPVLDTIQVDLYENSYRNLPFTEKDLENITTLITAMGKHKKIFLLFHYYKYKKIGDDISHLHPLKFLSVIYSNASLKSEMKSILNDHLKRKQLLGGLIQGFEGVIDRENFREEFHFFCEEINVSFIELEEYMENSNWKAMLDYLTNR